VKRRTWLIAAGGTAAALVVGWAALPSGAASTRMGRSTRVPVQRGELALNGWVKLTHQGKLCALVPRSEMGQGVLTAIPMLMAEELGIPLEALDVEQAPLGSSQDAIYGNVAMFESGLPFHPSAIEEAGWMVRTAKSSYGKLGRNFGLVVTGGSSSVADAWEVVRMAGALCRDTLKAAAAARLGVAASDVMLTGSACVAQGKTLSLTDLAREGADLSRFAPDKIILKDPKSFKLIGQPAPRVDVPAKTDGSAQFGIDVRLPGMVYAAVAMAPAIGGSITATNDRTTRAIPGVLGVEQFAGHHGGTAGVAVIGKTYWHARQGLDALKLSWSEGPNASFDSDAWLASLAAACKTGGGLPFRKVGDVDSAFVGASKVVEAEYHAPFLAHATMEPINCTAQFEGGKLTVWASTQVPSIARMAAAKGAGISTDAVTVHVKLLGGGFGRRLEVDFIAQAAQLARQLAPVPVQVIWPREEDLTHDFYRPAQAALLRAALDGQGNVMGLQVRAAGGAITPQIAKRMFGALGAPAMGPDKTTIEGLFDIPYGFAHQSFHHINLTPPVPMGYWRSVGHSMNAFFSECFIDEVAQAAGQDPLAFRLRYLEKAPRHAVALKLAAEKAGYGKPLPAGRAHGIALAESFGSIVAEIAEVSLEGAKPKVHRVTVAIDCGIAVNPNIIAQQMESGVVFGLSALYQRIDIKQGRVQQRNFPDYPVLAASNTPQVDTHIIASGRPPSGVGEPATPPAVPAVLNALARLSGKRSRTLPLQV
jgi:isoquinoline 1-oxidoreductase beta subunit